MVSRPIGSGEPSDIAPRVAPLRTQRKRRAEDAPEGDSVRAHRAPAAWSATARPESPLSAYARAVDHESLELPSDKRLRTEALVHREFILGQRQLREEHVFQAAKAAADRGDVPAQLQTARGYEKGIGTPVDVPKAVAYVKLAADAHHPRAQLTYALIRLVGKGVPADGTVAGRYLHRAIEQDHAPAHRLMARLYSGDFGWEPSATRAAHHATRADELEAETALRSSGAH